jgi:uncharacterized repeat protein (TIGR03847 family)
VSRIIYEHSIVERFVVGTVGVPGERQFFLQIESPAYSNCISVEKSQVAALAERFRELIQEVRRSKLASLDELGYSEPAPGNELVFPITEDFQAGIIGIAWDGEKQRIDIEIQAVSDLDIQDLISEDDEEEESEDLPDLLRAPLRIFQVRQFIALAEQVVNAGRQPCPFCGLPLDPGGHLCPRANGYRR